MDFRWNAAAIIFGVCTVFTLQLVPSSGVYAWSVITDLPATTTVQYDGGEPTTETTSETWSETTTTGFGWAEISGADILSNIPESVNDDAYRIYCEPGLCQRYNALGELVTKKHVACGFNGSFGDHCPPGRLILKIDALLRGRILNLHNDFRDRFARGTVHTGTFEPASRMPTLVWDDELANLAEINVRSCRFEHDECRSTERFLHAGQNLATGSYYLETDITDIVGNLTTLWSNEYIDAVQDILDLYAAGYNATIGHFTQMISDRTTAVGCGIVIYPKKMEDFVFQQVLYACNYAITNIIAQPVYLKGETTSRCVTGTNPHYSGLCSVAENALIKAYPVYD